MKDFKFSISNGKKEIKKPDGVIYDESNSFKRSTDNVFYGTFAKFKNISGVYEIYCKVSNKSYIGCTKQLQFRISKHFSNLRIGNHPNPNLQKDFDQYGYENFIVKVLEESDDNLIELERKHQIAKGIDNIYNEHINNYYISERLRKRYANADKSSHKTTEYRQKMSKLKTKYRIAQFDNEGKLIQVFPSAELIIKKYPEYKPNVIRGVCNGSKKSYKGFRWRYIDENDNLINTKYDN